MSRQVVIPYSEFRAHIDEIIESIVDTDDTVVIEIEGQASVILRAVAPDPNAPLRRGKRTPETLEAFRRAAGAWKDVDTDRLIADIYARRKASRPLLEL